MSVNHRYGEQLLDALVAFSEADTAKWYDMIVQYREPSLAVIHCAAYFMILRARGFDGYSKIDVASVLVWSNLDEGDSLKALAHLTNLPARDNPRTVTCTWTPTGEQGPIADYKQAAGGRLVVSDDSPAALQQQKTVITRKDGKWVVWEYDVSKPSGGGGRGGYRGYGYGGYGNVRGYGYGRGGRR